MSSVISSRKRKIDYSSPDQLSEEIPKRSKHENRYGIQQSLNELLWDSYGSFTFCGIDDSEEVGGKIKSIKLQNFMCHSNLEFTFGDKINFISGKNGSGKSAILTALVVGLGGRTADTNRAHRLSGLIQKGKNRACIEIVLNNSGTKRFNYEKYGNEIKVVRIITHSTSQYKIISEKGEVVSTKHDDLKLINMNFNIQVNNPVVILNQDTARTLMKRDDPKDMYKTFMNGTQLEEFKKHNLKLRNETAPFIKKLIIEKKQILNDTYADVQLYREKLKKMEELKKIRDEARNVQDELYWAYVYKSEKTLETLRSIKRESEKNLSQLREKVTNRDRIEQDLKDKQISLEAALKEHKANEQKVENEILELERSVQNTKEQISNKLSEMKRSQKRVASEKKSCDDIQSEIDNYESRSQELAAKKTHMEAQKSTLEKRLAELNAVMSTTQVHRQQLNNTLDAARANLSKTEQFYNNIKQKLAYKEEHLKELKTETNQLMVYSKWMPQIVEQIERAAKAGRFLKKPRGPLGSYIQLKESRWGPAIESWIGFKTLASFCVDNSQDYKMLKTIIERQNMPSKMEPSIYICKFFEKVHDVMRNETGDAHYINLFRSLKISDPVVANCLIDSKRIETVLLIPTNEEAYRIMEDVQSVPRNCKQAFTIQGDLFLPAPNYSSYSGSVGERTRFLQVSREQAIRHAEEEIQKVKLELSSVHDTIGQAKMGVHKSVKDLDDVNREIENLNQQIGTCERQLDDLKSNELPEAYDIRLLKEDLQYRQKNKKTSEEALRILENEKVVLLDKYKELNSKLQELRALKNEKNEEKQKVEAELTEAKNEYHELSVKRDHYVTLLKKEEAQYTNHEENILKFEKELESAEKYAKETHSERIQQTKEIDLLKLEVKKYRSEINTLENVIGDINSVPERFEQKAKKLEHDCETLKSLEVTRLKLKELLRSLEEKYMHIRGLVSLITNQSFLKILKEKGFMGYLTIDHDNELLKVVVKVEKAANDGSSTLTLSGGERSYSMVAFIIALLDNMYIPFIFLDEYDVFMDELNRYLIMRMLLNYAKSKPNQQFVFLTPHGNLPSELLTDVHFFRMKDPRSQDSENNETQG